MDEVTRKAALEKIDAMKSMVAYPDELRNDSLIEHYYRDLKILTDEYLQNMLNLKRFSQKKEVSKLREIIDNGGDWKDYIGYIAMINAFYMPNLNTIGSEEILKFILNTL